jgi:uncharacterized membrane protein YGL010W
MTQKLAARFADYRDFHTHPKNVFTHYIGIPLIVVSLLGLLSLVTFGGETLRDSLVRPDLGWLLLAVGIGFYFYLDWKIALPFSLVIIGCYLIGRSLSASVGILVGMQIVGWIAQYVGHLKYEKKSPAFYKNITHTLIGPLWIFAKLIRYGQRA